MANFLHFNPFKGDDEDHRRERAAEGGDGRGVGGGGGGGEEEEGGDQQPGRAGDQQVACLVEHLVMVSRLLIGEDELKTSQFEAAGQGGWVEKDPETTQSFKRRQQVRRHLNFQIAFFPIWGRDFYCELDGEDLCRCPIFHPPQYPATTNIVDGGANCIATTSYQYNLNKQHIAYSALTLEYYDHMVGCK